MRALITGITGQDGSYMAELLLKKGYEVHGLIRRTSTRNTLNIDHVLDQITLHYGDLSDSNSLYRIVIDSKPDEIYNLGAQSHVMVSYDEPEYTGNIVGLGVTRLLDILKSYPKIKLYQASTSEMFGGTNPPQNELSIFSPKSPYAIAKLYAYWMTRNYRESYGLFVCNGILFNHESPRRTGNIVSRKITRGAASIKLGLKDNLKLGNLSAVRDWGYAPEYVEAMWLMLQQDEPDDYVIGTGEAHTVEEFLYESFNYLDLDYKRYVTIDSGLFRPSEVDILKADYSKAKRVLGWSPRTYFKDLVKIMVDSDLKELGNGLLER